MSFNCGKCGKTICLGYSYDKNDYVCEEERIMKSLESGVLSRMGKKNKCIYLWSKDIHISLKNNMHDIYRIKENYYKEICIFSHYLYNTVIN